MDRAFKNQFIILAAILAGLTVFGQAIAWGASENYKASFIGHDYAVAGALAESGVDRGRITAAFASAENRTYAAQGEEILRAAGYAPQMQTSLLESAQRFYGEFSALLFVLCIAAAATVMFASFTYHRRQNVIFEDAESRIRRFMDGDTALRLTDTREGLMYRLFSAVNAMATSLTAHTQQEKKYKEFLRDTISDISHQLKTPLAALEMYNEIIMNENTGNGTVADFTQKSGRELSRMENLIQNLLKLARLDADAIELSPKEHRVGEFLRDAVQGLAARAEAEHKTITVTCGEDVMLCFDDVWLLEAVSNIVKNALDHTGAGGIIEVFCEETPVLTEIVIRDNGSGIHPEDIHHIFKRFYRSRFSKDKQGAGVGLTLAKTIVEKHGATIGVRSELGCGTAFRISFSNLSVL